MFSPSSPIFRTPNRPAARGFTLLEVMIAMSILAVGATSILSIFVAAIRFQSDRIEQNRVMEIYNAAMEHAEVIFTNFVPPDPKDPGAANKPSNPGQVTVDLRDWQKAEQSPDPYVRRAARKYKGYKYELTFDPGKEPSSAMVRIRVWGLESETDDFKVSSREVVMRSGIPASETRHDPRDRPGKRSAGRDDGG